MAVDSFSVDENEEVKATDKLPSAVEYHADLCVPSANKLGECPIWDSVNQLLLWLDIDGRKFWQFNPVEAEKNGMEAAVKSYELPAKAGSFALLQVHHSEDAEDKEDHEYLFAFKDGLSFYRPKSGLRHLIAEDLEPDLSTRLNDGRVDPQGRFVVSSCVLKGNKPIGAVYRLNADLSVEKLFQNVRCGNCINFSLDSEPAMFFADTMRDGEPEIWRFPNYASTGMQDPPEIFAKSGGKPDGSAIDSEGCLWNAEFGNGRVVRYMPDGTVNAIVHVPVKYTTSVAFGGHDLQTLFITDASVSRLSKAKLESFPPGAAGGLFSVRVPVAGIPERRFRGSRNLLDKTA
eukprot:TRINITY_DN24279_c0_g1_i5.p1 TRINITY_DN24279_c0_g1~~TRINITY_DN24279_c0_g1_i5.p1  ORF type:complete len:357 (-),score=58.66 TRINITY_DN24279_c0_g1_i5:12-1049(-)